MNANSLKVTLPRLQSTKVPPKMKVKKYATAFGSITPLLQPDHVKYHGYSPDEGPNLDLTDDAELEAAK